MKVNHSRDMKCKDCKMAFQEYCKYEEHLAKEHGNEKTFDCELCDKSFYTNWRLRKHTRSHEDRNMQNSATTSIIPKYVTIKSFDANLNILNLSSEYIKIIVRTDSVSSNTRVILPGYARS